MYSSNHSTAYEGNKMDKFHNLTHYIVSKCDDPVKLGATKLNKVLWFSDALSYLYKGQSISGAKYEKRQFGPVPKDIMSVRKSLKRSGLIFERTAIYGGYPQTHFISLRSPNISGFTSDEISLVDDVMESICHSHTASSISEHTHDIIWEAAEIGEEIPLCAIFASRQGELSGDDMTWAKNQVNHLGLELAKAC